MVAITHGYRDHSRGVDHEVEAGGIVVGGDFISIHHHFSVDGDGAGIGGHPGDFHIQSLQAVYGRPGHAGQLYIVDIHDLDGIVVLTQDAVVADADGVG